MNKLSRNHSSSGEPNPCWETQISSKCYGYSFARLFCVHGCVNAGTAGLVLYNVAYTFYVYVSFKLF